MFNIINIIKAIISIFILFKLCQKFNFKVTFFICFLLEIIYNLLTNGVVYWPFIIGMSLVISFIESLVAYKIYDYSDDSFFSFLFINLAVQLIVLIPIIGIFLRQMMH